MSESRTPCPFCARKPGEVHSESCSRSKPGMIARLKAAAAQYASAREKRMAEIDAQYRWVGGTRVRR